MREKENPVARDASFRGDRGGALPLSAVVADGGDEGRERRVVAVSRDGLDRFGPGSNERDRTASPEAHNFVGPR